LPEPVASRGNWGPRNTRNDTEKERAGKCGGDTVGTPRVLFVFSVYSVCSVDIFSRVRSCPPAALFGCVYFVVCFSFAIYISIDANDFKLIKETPSNKCADLFTHYESKLASQYTLSIAQAWDAIVRCLGDGSLRRSKTRSLANAIYGDDTIWLPGPNVSLGLLNDQRVKEISVGLGNVSASELRNRYFALRRTFLGIDISSYEHPVSEDDWDFTKTNFDALVEFMQLTASLSRSVAVLISG
jgi:Domain of unknown function (DUF1877)